MARADRWAILTMNARTWNPEGVYAYKSGAVYLSDVGTVEALLGKIDGDLTVSFRPGVRLNNRTLYDSLEATWRGIMPLIKPESIVVVYLQIGNNDVLTPEFIGRAKVAGNPDRPGNTAQQYRIVGLGQEDEDLDASMSDNYVQAEGQDLAALMNYYAEGFLPQQLAQSIQSTGVVNTGKISAGYGSLREMTVALASLAIKEGKHVRFGVHGSRRWYFGLRDERALDINENTPGTEIDWPEPQSHGKITAVRWTIADGTASMPLFFGATTTNATKETPDILSHLTDSGVNDWGRRVKALGPPNEVSGFLQLPANRVTYSINVGTPVSSWVGLEQDGTFNLARINDDNPTSYAVIEAGPGGMFVLRAELAAGVYEAQDIVAVKINLRLDETSPDMNDNARTSAFLGARTAAEGSAGSVRLFNHKDTSFDQTIVFGDRARGRNTDEGSTPIQAGNYIQIFMFTGQAGLRFAVEDFRIYTLNKVELDAQAENQYKFPAVATLQARIDDLQPVRGFASVTKRGERVPAHDALEVAQVEYVLSPAGAFTRYSIGEGSLYEPEAGAAGARIKSRDQSAQVGAVRGAMKGGR